MKKIATLLFILSSLSLSKLHSQNLYNTYWTTYDSSGTIFTYVYVGTDTLFFSQDNINYTAASIFKISGSQFTMYDLPFATTCLVTDTGKYNFSIQNDTLKMTLISDPCFGRKNGSTNNYSVRMYVGIQEENMLASMKIYPNPFTESTTIELDKAYPQVDIQIHDITGKLVRTIEISNSRDVEIQRQAMKPGVYFIKVSIDRTSTVKKLIIK